MTDREQFTSKVEPIMDRVRQELQSRQAEEVRRYMRSPAYILSGISGPDGGMASQAVALDSLKMTGEWSSKTVEDYVEMVKNELRKEGITVTPELEEMMIDKMARDQVPQSSVDYILRKAAGNTIFGLPEEARKTPLQREVEQRAEEMYNPSKVEKGIGWGLGAAADFVTLGGFSGGIAGGLKFVGADLAVNAVIDTVDAKQRKEVPSVVLPGYEEEWLEMNEAKKEEIGDVPEQEKPSAQHEVQEAPEERAPIQEVKEEDPALIIQKETDNTVQVQDKTEPVRNNTGGWQGILTSLGLNGISDIGRNAGYILAMLPDILLGMFTGTNLLNKAGHEQLAKRDGVTVETSVQNRFLQYEDQPMNPRIRDAQIQGNTMIASIDGIPVTITLPEKVLQAHAAGALPLGTLANAVLERCDRMQEVNEARERFEEESRSQTRGISQR